MSVIEQQRFITALNGGMIGSVAPTELTANVLDPLKDVLKRDLDIIFENTKQKIDAAAGGGPAAAVVVAAAAAAAAANRCRLSINWLNFDVSWIKLGLEFSKAGTVRFAKTIRQKTGCAVVEFATEGEATKAQKQFDKNLALGVPAKAPPENGISVNKFSAKPAVFVTNCSGITVDKIANHFSVDSKCVFQTKDKTACRVEFVSYLQAEESFKLHNTELSGKKIYVRWNAN
jgi:RNA recognition motif-containing protein